MASDVLELTRSDRELIAFNDFSFDVADETTAIIAAANQPSAHLSFEIASDRPEELWAYAAWCCTDSERANEEVEGA